MPNGRLSSLNVMVTVAIVIAVVAMAFGLIRIFARVASAQSTQDVR